MYQKSDNHLLYDSLNAEKARKKNKVAQNKRGGEISIQKEREKMQLETIRREKKRLEKELQKIHNKGHYMIKRPAKLSRFHGFHYTLHSQNQSNFGKNKVDTRLTNLQLYEHNESLGMEEEHPATKTQITELRSVFPHKLRKERMYKLVGHSDHALTKYGASPPTGHTANLSKKTSFLDDAQLQRHSHFKSETEKAQDSISKMLFHSPFGKKSRSTSSSLPPISSPSEVNKEVQGATQENRFSTKKEGEETRLSSFGVEATKSLQDELVATRVGKAKKRESMNSIAVSDMSLEIERVTKLLDNPNSYFDNERFAPDGGLRTCYLLPPQEKRFEEAKKARYLRQKDPFNRDVELTIPEIFSKE